MLYPTYAARGGSLTVCIVESGKWQARQADLCSGQPFALTGGMARYTIPAGTKVGIAEAEEMNNYARGYVRWRHYKIKRELTFSSYVLFSGVNRKRIGGHIVSFDDVTG